MEWVATATVSTSRTVTQDSTTAVLVVLDSFFFRNLVLLLVLVLVLGVRLALTALALLVLLASASASAANDSSSNDVIFLFLNLSIHSKQGLIIQCSVLSQYCTMYRYVAFSFFSSAVELPVSYLHQSIN
mmetsp:Transcript_9045/g.13026  ORF Transcript_9045/g.13026 Transcript_9045/m.13026 type:complete len:130 (-) Transcript_9045:63-452(-)